MASTSHSGPPRLTPLGIDDLDADQRALWESITSSARGADPRVVRAAHLGGPFDAWLRAPQIGLRAAQLGEVLRFSSELDPVLRETAILAAGAHFRSEFEFWIHGQIAVSEGMDPATLEQIATGVVDAATAGELVALVNQIARVMLAEGGLDDALYGQAARVLGEHRLMEVISLVGYYTLVSLTLNVFRVPLPEGVTPRWAR